MCCDENTLRRYGRVFIAMTVFLITFVPISTYVFIFSNWFEYHTDRNKFLWLAPFYVPVASIWINYFLACTTHPGGIPTGYNPVVAQEKDDAAVASVNGDTRGSNNGGSAMLSKRPASKKKRKAQAQHPNSQAHPDGDSSQDPLLQQHQRSSSKSGGVSKPRWCRHCLSYRPPRSHHCSYCERCILRMDHHCPWLNTCVGHRNLPHFVRFVVSVTIASSNCLALLALRLRDLLRYQTALMEYYSNPGSIRHKVTLEYYTPPANDLEVLMFIVNLIILFALLLTVGLLSVWQLFYISANTTTIESFENSKIEELARRGKIPVAKKYPYDLGTWRNLQMVFGKHWYLWWIPASAPGDGIVFEMAEDADLNAAWPPREYYLYKKYPYGKPKKTHATGTQGAAIEVPSSRIVRRDSEGYLVQSISAADREEQLRLMQEAADKIDSHAHDGTAEGTDMAQGIVPLHHKPPAPPMSSSLAPPIDDSSTDFDSIEDEFDEDLKEDGIPRVPLSNNDNVADSDDEPLGVQQQKYSLSKKAK